jgi:hypothetical protein
MNKDIKCSFYIQKNDLLAMRELQGYDETRTGIFGVNFEVNKEQVIMVATNGRLLGVLKPFIGGDLDVDDPVSFTVNYPLVRSITGFGGGKEKERISISLLKDGMVEFLGNDKTKIRCPAIQGLFPKWRGLIPKEQSVPAKFDMSFHYLGQFYKAAKLFTGDKTPNLTMRAHQSKIGENTCDTLPYSIWIQNYANFYGLLMPLRSYNEPEIPCWLNTEEPKKLEQPVAA